MYKFIDDMYKFIVVFLTSPLRFCEYLGEKTPGTGLEKSGPRRGENIAGQGIYQFPAAGSASVPPSLPSAGAAVRETSAGASPSPARASRAA